MSGLQNLVNNVDLSGFTQQAEQKSSSASSSLTEMISNVSDKANTAVGNASEVANAVTGILNLFK